MKEEFYKTITSTDDLEFRAETDKETGDLSIMGYASLYNSPSRTITIVRNGINEQVIERIEPGAFEGADFSDCIYSVEHDNNQVVGRTGKNLQASNNAKGLFFKLTLPKDEAQRTVAQSDLLKNVQQGIIRGCSFAARIAENDLVREGDNLVHIIKRFSVVRDLTATVLPAYPETWLAKRNFDDMKVNGEQEKQAEQPAEPAQKANEGEVEKISLDFEFLKLD